MKPCKDCPSPRAPQRSRCYSCYGKSRRGTDAGAGTVTRVSEWQVLKGDEVVTLRSERRSMRPAAVALEEFLRPAQPVEVKVSAVRPSYQHALRAHVVLLVPDVQIGYRRLDDGSLEPFHDEQAMSAAVQVAAALAPHKVVHLGDLVDFAPLSRFAQEPGCAQTTQQGLDRAHRFLAEMQAVTPGSEHFLIAGNHDVRAERFMAKNAPELARVKAPGQRWPAMSVPSLLALDTLGITYVDAYPAGRLYLRDDLVVQHGDKVNSAGSTAAMYVKDAVTCTVLGHVHRAEWHARTFGTARGQQTVWAASPGTLSRIDGAVPSFHSATHTSTGGAARHIESWQQGLGVVMLMDGVPPIYEHIPIHDGRAFYRGRVIVAAPTEETA